MRVYLPLTLPALATAYGAGELGPAPLLAYAVTPGLRSWLGLDAASTDGTGEATSRTASGNGRPGAGGKGGGKGNEAAHQEELEYEALTAAARASLGLLAQDTSAPPRRVVVAAEVPESAVAEPEPEPDADPAETAGLVRLAQAVPLAKVAAVHADAAADDTAAEAVAAAAAAWRSAERADGYGDAEVPEAVAEVEDHELLWYATQEIPDLLA